MKSLRSQGRCYKPFPQRKIPPFGGTFLLSLVRSGLVAGLLALIATLALTARVLLLLAGLLPAALLLPGLLTRVLILLTGVLILLTRVVLVALVRHVRGSPLLNVTRDNRKQLDLFQFHRDHSVARS
jgi:hypothetical protein